MSITLVNPDGLPKVSTDTVRRVLDLVREARNACPGRGRMVSIDVSQTVPRGDFQQIAATLILC